MRGQNADGSIPEMCGTGARCAALWIATEGCTRPAAGRVELITDAGPRPCNVEAGQPRRGVVGVDMGMPRAGPPPRLPTLGAGPPPVGNPHLVLFRARAAAA